MVEEAFSFSLLSMAFISVRVMKMVDSSAKLAGRLAAERLSSFTGVTSWIGSSKTSSTAGGVGVEA